jgi:large subunit ribosomal protein L15
MKLDELKPTEGSTKKRTRVGRGIAAGKGKTAGRGTKGQGARTGGGKGPYFEGGQLPLVRRLPFKRGFTNIFRIEYQEVSVERLNTLDSIKAGSEVTPALLSELGVIRSALEPVVILGNGDIKKKLTIHAHRFTRSAAEKIEKAGGKIVTLELMVTGAHATVKKLPKAQLEQIYSEKNG